VDGNDCVIQVKGNCKLVLKASKQIAKSRRASTRYKTREKSRGRIENRRIRVFNNLPEKLFPDGWVGIKSIIEIKTWGYRKKRKYEKFHYYISTLPNMKAKEYAKGIRSHWFIENKLHWVKDTILGEDKSRIKSHKISSIMSIFRSSVINIFQINKIKSLSRGIEKYANRLETSIELINICHIRKI